VRGYISGKEATCFGLAIICQTCLAYDDILKWPLQIKTVLSNEILTDFLNSTQWDNPANDNRNSIQNSKKK